MEDGTAVGLFMAGLTALAVYVLEILSSAVSGDVPVFVTPETPFQFRSSNV